MLFLGTSCIHLKDSPQALQGEYLLTGPKYSEDGHINMGCGKDLIIMELAGLAAKTPLLTGLRPVYQWILEDTDRR